MSPGARVRVPCAFRPLGAALAASLAAACAGPPDGFVVEVQSVGVSADCTQNDLVVVANVLLDNAAGDGAAHVVPARAEFEVLGASLRVPLDEAPTDVAAGDAASIGVSGDDPVRGNVCSACSPGTPAPLVVATLVFRVNGATVDALAPPTQLVCE